MSNLNRSIVLLVIVLTMMVSCSKTDLPVIEVSDATRPVSPNATQPVATPAQIIVRIIVQVTATPASPIAIPLYTATPVQVIVVPFDTPIPAVAFTLAATRPPAQVTVTPIDTPTPEIQASIVLPFGYGLKFDDPGSQVGTYTHPILKPGTGMITGKVVLVDAPVGTPILVYKPAHMQSDPKLPPQFVGWINSFYEYEYGLGGSPCTTHRTRANDASGWVITSSGEQWVLEPQARIVANPGESTVNFAPDICIVVPGYAVFKFENVHLTSDQDTELPTVNLPRHPVEHAGWVVY